YSNVARGFVNDVDGDFWLKPGRDFDGHHERANCTNGTGQLDQTSIDLDPFNVTQTFRDILARDGAIETALFANTRLKGQGDIAQPFGLLLISFYLLLQLALLGYNTLLVIR